MNTKKIILPDRCKTLQRVEGEDRCKNKDKKDKPARKEIEKTK